MVSEKTAAFLEEIKSVHWFENSGRPNEKYDMVFSLYEANDGFWGMRYVEVWESQICPLEDIAEEKIGDDAIEEIFKVVSDVIGDTVWQKFEEYIYRQHVYDDLEVRSELFDKMRRDMAWACVEKVLDIPGFFMMLTDIYKEGYFPCSWNGAYPSGQAVVL